MTCYVSFECGNELKKKVQTKNSVNCRRQLLVGTDTINSEIYARTVV
jgi:hypothetical protein